MASSLPPLTRIEVERILKDSQRTKEELDALRPKTNWIKQATDRLIRENHLSEKVRQALEG